MVVDWRNHLTASAALFERFKTRAEELTVEVLLAPSPDQALKLLVNKMKELQIKSAAASPLTLVDCKRLETLARKEDIDLSFEMNRDSINEAGLGISQFDLGIAESGTLVQDASSLHTRLVSILPPIHLALVPAAALVETFAEALQVIERVYGDALPPFLSFVSGPSKTADIERVLTIGVHGPKRMIILAVADG